jgi:hypothetical protein
MHRKLTLLSYNMSWGPLPWPYVSEIFPTRIREPGIAIGVAAQWLFSFIYTLTNPYMVNNIKYGTLFFWGVLNLIIAVVSYFLIKETQGLSLEEINSKFDGTEALLQAKLAGEESESVGGKERTKVAAAELS